MNIRIARTTLLVGLLTLTGIASAATTTLKQLPPDLVGAMGATMAREAAADPAYAIGANGCAKLGSGKALLQGCFDKQGPRFENGGEKLGLQLVGFGRGEKLSPVHLQRMKPEANRVTYRGKDVSEWWRVLPMGYEQGFTVERAPKGSGPVVLALRASARPVVEGDSVRWGNVRYGKLVVTDAAGRKLPAHLTVDGAQLKLAFDSRDARFPVTVDPMLWIEQEVTASDGAANDRFGYSVALSADGTTALVGAPYHTVGGELFKGAAYVFTNSGGTWTQVAELTADGGAAYDGFGNSVALSADGAVALVGTSHVSAAYLFRRSGGGWSQSHKFSGCGGDSVALSADGNVVLTADTTACAFNNSGGIWSDATELTAAPPLHLSVALSADGATALVTEAQGSFVFSNTGTWKPTAELPRANAGALSADGATALLVSPVNLKNFQIFSNSGGTWNQTAGLTVANAQSESFGSSVALSADGTTALVGASVKNSNQGSAYLFKKSGSTWNQVDERTASDGTSGDNFGNSVALSGDGTMALVGSPDRNGARGAAYLFTYAPTPTVTGLDNVVVTRGSGGSKVLTLSGTGRLTVTATSDNTDLLPDTGITGVTGCAAAGQCILALTPAAADRTGTATVTVTVADAYGHSAQGSFLFTVIPPAPPGAPTVSAATNLTVASGKSGTNTVTLTGNGALTVSATSGDTTLLPNEAITGADACTASGRCTLTLKPSGKSGAVIVTVTATDGYGQRGQGVFLITVTDPASDGGSSGGGGGDLGLWELLLLGSLLLVRRDRGTNRHSVA